MLDNFFRDSQEPNWIKSHVLGEINEKNIEELRKSIVSRTCLDSKYVFVASDRSEATEDGTRLIPSTIIPIVNVIYIYRIYITPRNDILKIFRRFEVACNFAYEDPSFYGDIAMQIELINRVAPLDLMEVGMQFLHFCFRFQIDHEACVRIQDLLISLDSNLYRIGLWDYVYAWDQQDDSNPIADRIFMNQKLTLWWEP